MGCFLALHEGGFFLGASLVGAGMGLAPFATGYLYEARRSRRISTLRVTPSIGLSSGGISLSGRF
jgi:hypothetical protein